VTRAVEAELGGGMNMIFRIGEQLQRGAADMAWGALAGDEDAARRALKTAFDVAGGAAAAAGPLAPSREGRLAWLELRNKLEAYNLFAYVDLALGLRPGDPVTLHELLERASALGPYRSVWATEGVGYFYAETARGAGRAALDLSAHADSLPASSLAALHAGAGLSFAASALEPLGPRCTSRELSHALEQFIALCRACSRGGYEGAAYEALGLWTRSLSPHLVTDIDRQLSEAGDEMVGYFWHGVGRALYFAPTNALPVGGDWPAADAARGEPPHELGRVNALAGLTWALALVNVRHPEVLECFLARHGRGPEEGDALANGFCSAFIVWRDCSPADTYLEALCEHRPADAGAARLWERQVARPCAEAAGRYYRVLRDAGRVGEVFRYRSLAELVDGLERRQA
jgi:hypothetical protein